MADSDKLLAAGELFESLKRSYREATPEERKAMTANVGALHVVVAKFHAQAQDAARRGDDADFFAAVVTSGLALIDAVKRAGVSV